MDLEFGKEVVVSYLSSMDPLRNRGEKVGECKAKAQHHVLKYEDEKQFL